MPAPRIVECVANFSEGRDRDVIEAIAAAIRGAPGAFLLDVDPGADANRTVYTFAGEADAVLAAALAAARAAFDRIDMRRQRGAHPRLGALDVCPFVPLRGATMDDCVELARRFGEHLAAELGLPVYLYEKAATSPERASLAAIRAGEYEGLPERILKPEWKPDFGPAAFVPSWGATIAGAREFLIAYNVNLKPRGDAAADEAAARDIAAVVRESGRPARGPGLLKSVRAIGWYMEGYGCAQVSMNLLDYRVAPIHAAYEAVKAEAAKRGLTAAGSELVGLAPLDALLEAGRFYAGEGAEGEAAARAAAKGAAAGAGGAVPCARAVPSEAELINAAIRGLGLDSVSPFDPDRKIVEYALRRAGLA